MTLLPLPAFSDNYLWLLHDGRQAVVVDPGDAAPVADALDRHGLQLAAILVTHHHGDHVGGVDALRPRLQGPVYGPASEAIPRPFQPVQGGDTVQVLGLQFRVIDVPGHTSGHIAYFTDRVHGEPPLLFCGDTLFSAGCGRLFEGTAAQMHRSLSALAALPGDTRVCCAHEYTLSNLRFAATVEPGNGDIADHVRLCQARRAEGLPTLPSSIALERRINPFLRCDEPGVRAAALRHDAGLPPAATPEAVLATLREWKNQFR